MTRAEIAAKIQECRALMECVVELNGLPKDRLLEAEAALYESRRSQAVIEVLRLVKSIPSESQRKVLLKYAIHGQSFKEIDRENGYADGWASKNYQRAIKAIESL